MRWTAFASSEPIGPQQFELSRRLEEAVLSIALAEESPLSVRQRAHWRACCIPGAGAWLAALPSTALSQSIAPAHMHVLLRRRLGSPVFDADGTCVLCGADSDRWGDHAIACPAGGCRVARHHRVRAALARLAEAGGHRPTLEPVGLLPPKPDADDEPHPPPSRSSTVGQPPASVPRRARAAQGELRRPADVFIPVWWGGRPAAFDAAITSGTIPRRRVRAARDAVLLLREYEEFKRSYLDTDAACKREGIEFCPFVLEADGGVGPSASGIVRKLADDAAVCSGLPRPTVIERVRQELSLAVAMANSSALIRRRPPPAALWAPHNSSAAAAVAADDAVRDAPPVAAASVVALPPPRSAAHPVQRAQPLAGADAGDPTPRVPPPPPTNGAADGIAAAAPYRGGAAAAAGTSPVTDGAVDLTAASLASGGQDGGSAPPLVAVGCGGTRNIGIAEVVRTPAPAPNPPDQPAQPANPTSPNNTSKPIHIRPTRPSNPARLSCAASKGGDPDCCGRIASGVSGDDGSSSLRQRIGSDDRGVCTMGQTTSPYSNHPTIQPATDPCHF